MSKISRRIRILLIILLIPLLGVGGFVIWGETPLGPMPEALEALKSEAKVTVDTHPWLTFTPTGQNPTTGLVIYPGGRVDARAYAPLARAVAEQGYLVVIVPVPLNLAFFGANRAAEVIAAYPEIRHWATAGHSLGGVVAAQFASQNTDKVQGLVLWASYPASSIASAPLKIVSISATLDGLSTPAKIEASRPDLPPDTKFVAIQGGDHAQFGWYGPQPGDNPASINRLEQMQQIVTATVELLRGISE